MRRLGMVTMVAVLCLFIAACDEGGGSPRGEETEPTPTPASDEAVDQGEAIFTGEANVVTPACMTCHTLGEGDLVGPDLQGVATRAQGRVTDMSAEAYLRESIVDPQEYIVPGFPEGGMPDVFEEQLGEEDLDALVAYLLTLEQP